MLPEQALTALRAAFAGVSVRDCAAAVLPVEVVEVKNACPFQTRVLSISAKTGSARKTYVLADTGPRQQVWAHALRMPAV
jgi:hypothetical protein